MKKSKGHISEKVECNQINIPVAVRSVEIDLDLCDSDTAQSNQPAEFPNLNKPGPLKSKVTPKISQRAVQPRDVHKVPVIPAKISKSIKPTQNMDGHRNKEIAKGRQRVDRFEDVRKEPYSQKVLSVDLDRFKTVSYNKTKSDRVYKPTITQLGEKNKKVAWNALLKDLKESPRTINSIRSDIEDNEEDFSRKPVFICNKSSKHTDDPKKIDSKLLDEESDEDGRRAELDTNLRKATHKDEEFDDDIERDPDYVLEIDPELINEPEESSQEIDIEDKKQNNKLDSPEDLQNHRRENNNQIQEVLEESEQSNTQEQSENEELQTSIEKHKVEWKDVPEESESDKNLKKDSEEDKKRQSEVDLLIKDQESELDDKLLELDKRLLEMELSTKLQVVEYDNPPDNRKESKHKRSGSCRYRNEAKESQKIGSENTKLKGATVFTIDLAKGSSSNKNGQISEEYKYPEIYDSYEDFMAKINNRDIQSYSVNREDDNNKDEHKSKNNYAIENKNNGDDVMTEEKKLRNNELSKRNKLNMKNSNNNEKISDLIAKAKEKEQLLNKRSACLKIQRAYKKYILKVRVHELCNESIAKKFRYRQLKDKVIRSIKELREGKKNELILSKYMNHCASIIQTHYRKYKHHSKRKRLQTLRKGVENVEKGDILRNNIHNQDFENDKKLILKRRATPNKNSKDLWEYDTEDLNQYNQDNTHNTPHKSIRFKLNDKKATTTTNFYKYNTLEDKPIKTVGEYKYDVEGASVEASKANTNNTKRDFLKRKEVYDPFKSIKESKRGNVRSVVQEKESARMESLVARAEEEIQTKRDFLKRRSKKVESKKVDWQKVTRRIDCWNPKQKSPSRPRAKKETPKTEPEETQMQGKPRNRLNLKELRKVYEQYHATNEGNTLS